MLEVAPEALLELAALEVGELEPDAALDRLGQALAEEDERVVEPLRVDPLDAEPLRQPGEELVERLVGDRAAQPRVDLGVDRARVEITRSTNQIDEQSAKPSSSVTPKVAARAAPRARPGR